MKPQASWLQSASEYTAATYRRPEFIVERGDGCWVWDEHNRRYLDLTGGIGVNALGHAHPKVVQAITEQVGKVSHTSNAFFNAPSLAMAKQLGQLLPGYQSFLCNSGTEAVEAALKLARRHFHVRGEHRPRFVAMHNGFHGRSFGALSVTGQRTYRQGFEPFLPEVDFVPFDDLPALQQALNPNTAAVIVEPIQGNGGVRLPSPGYLAQIAQLCRSMDTLLIVDEIQTGLGRTGRWFGFEHDNITPDIICLAKALGGGLPLGAMMAPKALMEAFGPGTHGTTFGGNPVACAAGLATLSVLLQHDILAHVRTQSKVWHSELLKLPNLRHVRIQGLMVGLVCQKPAAQIKQACLEEGMLVTTAGPDVVRLLPPLTIDTVTCTHASQILQKVLA